MWQLVEVGKADVLEKNSLDSVVDSPVRKLISTCFSNRVVHYMVKTGVKQLLLISLITYIIREDT